VLDMNSRQALSDSRVTSIEDNIRTLQVVS